MEAPPGGGYLALRDPVGLRHAFAQQPQGEAPPAPPGRPAGFSDYRPSTQLLLVTVTVYSASSWVMPDGTPSKWVSTFRQPRRCS